MIPVIRPYGSIADYLIENVVEERPGRFALTDRCGNRYGIEEETFNLLKERGVKVYEIKQSNNQQF